MSGKETTAADAAENRAAAAKGLKHNLYEHVTLKPRTLEIVISVCGVLIVGLVIYGIATR